jgi:hypothetical protein
MSNLIITASNTKLLSKQQAQFNRLIKQIENLKKDIAQDTIKCDELVKIYATQINTVEQKMYEKQFDLLVKIDGACELYKLSKKNFAKVRSVMGFLFDSIFANQIPTAQQEALHDKWFENSYKNQVKEQFEEGREEIEEMLRNTFGFDINLSDFESNPNDFEQFQQEIHKKIAEGKIDTQKNTKSAKKKTQKELEIEAKAKQIDELKNKSLRSIYIDLVKLLHPDTETNEDAKIEKEEVLKMVTVAYENKDLVTLLALEMHWINRNTEDLQKLTDEKLNLFNEVLKEQIKALKKEQILQRNHPKYASIEDFVYLKLDQAIAKIKKNAKAMKREVTNLENSIEATELMRQDIKFFETILNKFHETYQEPEFDFSDFFSMARY